MKKWTAIFTEISSAVALGVFCAVSAASAALPVESVASSDALCRRGYVLMQSGLFKPAALALKNAIQMNPADLNARRYLSYTLMQLGSYAEAEEQLFAIAKVSALTSADYYLSGSIHVRMGNTDQALKDYKSALQIEPDMPAAKAGIIELFVLASDFQGATFLCNDCIKKAKDRVQYDYFQTVSQYIRTHQVAAETKPDYVKPEGGQQIISPTAVSAPPTRRDLIPQTIQNPLLAPPKIAPIATRAKA